jgi:hypothetical protein
MEGSPQTACQQSGSRYSVPARYVGESVVIRERPGSYGIRIRARSSRTTDLSMGTRWYRSLRSTRALATLREPLTNRSGAPYDPGYPTAAEVSVRDLGIYAASVEAASVWRPPTWSAGFPRG